MKSDKKLLFLNWLFQLIRYEQCFVVYEYISTHTTCRICFYVRSSISFHVIIMCYLLSNFVWFLSVWHVYEIKVDYRMFLNCYLWKSFTEYFKLTHYFSVLYKKLYPSCFPSLWFFLLVSSQILCVKFPPILPHYLKTLS